MAVSVPDYLKLNGGYAQALQSPSGSAATDTAYLQELLDNASQYGYVIVIPPGTWMINATLTFDHTGTNSPGPIILGYGMYTSILKGDDALSANSPIIDIDQVGNNDYCFGFRMDGVGLVGQDAGRNGQVGLKFSGCWNAAIERCRFDSHPDDGIWLDYGGTDATSSSVVRIADNRIIDNDGLGFNMGSATGPVPNLHIFNNWFSANSQHIVGLIGPGKIEGNQFAYSTSTTLPGVEINGSTSHCLATSISHNAFEGAEGGEIWLKQTYGTLMEGNRFAATYLSGQTPAASYGIRLGSDDGATDSHSTTIRNTLWVIPDRTGDGLADYVAYDIMAYAKNTIIEGTFWQEFHSDSGYVEIDDGANQSTLYTKYYEEWANVAYDRPWKTNTVSGAASSYQIDLTDGLRHVLTYTATGAKTITFPTQPPSEAGRYFELTIQNSSGGVITITTAGGTGTSAPRKDTYVDPADGTWTTAQFRFQSGDDRYWQSTQWVNLP